MAAKQADVRFVELEAWMRKQGKKLRPFAIEAGLDKMTLHRLLAGKPKRFDPDIIRKISNATDGRIAEPQFTAYLARLRRAA